MAVKMLMKGAILPGNSTVEIKDFEIPKPGYGQALIKTKATTICGSDIRCIYREHTGKEGFLLFPWRKRSHTARRCMPIIIRRSFLRSARCWILLLIHCWMERVMRSSISPKL